MSRTATNEMPTKTFVQTRPNRWRFRPSKALQDAKASRISIFTDPLPNHRNQYQSPGFELNRESDLLSRTKRNKASRIPILTDRSNHQNTCESQVFASEKVGECGTLSKTRRIKRMPYPNKAPQNAKVGRTPILKDSTNNQLVNRCPNRWSFRPSKALQDAKASRISIFTDPLPNHCNQYQSPGFELNRESDLLSRTKRNKASRVLILADRSNHQNTCESQVFASEKVGECGTLSKTRRIKRMPYPNKAPRNAKVGRTPILKDRTNNPLVNQCYSPNFASKRDGSSMLSTKSNAQRFRSNCKKDMQAKAKSSGRIALTLGQQRQIMEDRHNRRLELEKSVNHREVDITTTKNEEHEMGQMNSSVEIANNLEAELMILIEGSVANREVKSKISELSSSQTSNIGANVIDLKTRRDLSMHALKLCMEELKFFITKTETRTQKIGSKVEISWLWNKLTNLQSRHILREARFHTIVAESELESESSTEQTGKH